MIPLPDKPRIITRVSAEHPEPSPFELVEPEPTDPDDRLDPLRERITSKLLQIETLLAAEKEAADRANQKVGSLIHQANCLRQALAALNA